MEGGRESGPCGICGPCPCQPSNLIRYRTSARRGSCRAHSALLSTLIESCSDNDVHAEGGVYPSRPPMKIRPQGVPTILSIMLLSVDTHTAAAAPCYCPSTSHTAQHCETNGTAAQIRSSAGTSRLLTQRIRGYGDLTSRLLRDSICGLTVL